MPTHVLRHRRRPSRAEWLTVLGALTMEHSAHGWLPDAVVAALACAMGVSISTIERRYDEHVRAWELRVGAVILGARDKAAIASAPSFGAAAAILAAGGTAVALPLLERAIWRDGGDRALTALRQAECERRAALRAAGCAQAEVAA